MARKRMISPEFLTDEKILELSIPARLFFIGTWLHANDEGVFKDSPKQLKAQIYPANEEITINIIIEYIKMMVNLKLFTKGTNIDDSPLLKVTNWNDWQRINRPTPSKYVFTPLQITEDSLKTHGVISDQSLNDHGSISDGSLPVEDSIVEVSIEEVKVEVKENSPKTNAQKIKDEFTFDRFYELYPRKIKKDMAFNAYKVIAAKYLADVYDGLERYVEKWKADKTGLEFIPYPSTWLNQKQWTDEIVIEEKSKKPKYQDGLDEEISKRNHNISMESKRMSAYLKKADDEAVEDIPDLNALRKDSNVQSIGDGIGQLMSQVEPDTSANGE